MAVVGAAEELVRVAELDPGAARAGEARRRNLPQEIGFRNVDEEAEHDEPGS